ncbi:MAG: DUF3251 domain-containing protein [bacterium]
MFRNAMYLAVGALITLQLLGCSDSAGNADVARRLGELEKKLKDIEADREFRALMDSFRGMAFLRPGDSGYSLIEFNLGRMTVQMVDVTPFASGSRVALRFGNFSSAGFDGVSATLEYGPTDEKGNVVTGETRAKEVKFSEIFRPGSWNTVSVTLDGIQPAQLGYIRITNVAHSGIRLTGR